MDTPAMDRDEGTRASSGGEVGTVPSAHVYAATADCHGRPLKSALVSGGDVRRHHSRMSSGSQGGGGVPHRPTHSTSSSSSRLDLPSSPGLGSKVLSPTSTTTSGAGGGLTSASSTRASSPAPGGGILTPPGGHSRRNSDLAREMHQRMDALRLSPRQEYDRKVGFDLLGEPLHDAEPNDFSFTLQSKSRNYSRNRNSRTFLVATDVLSHSQNALEWTLDTLIDDGDELVALRVLEYSPNSTWGRTKLIDHVRSQEARARQEAEALMKQIMEHNEDIQLSIIVEFVVGEVKQTIKSMIAMYRPDSLIMGTRGNKGIKGLLLGSVSKSCISFSPIPVVIVRVERKLAKSKAKRESTAPSADKNYTELVRSGSATNLGLELSRTRSREVTR